MLFAHDMLCILLIYYDKSDLMTAGTTGFVVICILKSMLFAERLICNTGFNVNLEKKHDISYLLR